MSGTVGSRIGKYLLLRELGRGGMGIVHEALDTELGRRVALKTLLPALEADPVTRPHDEDRFVREARINARLRHPNIVTVFDAGVIDGRRYLSMELLDGLPLHLWWKTPGLSLPRKVAVLRDAALGLDHAHEQGVLHRDLKPPNLFVAAGDRPYVMDFGLSKCVHDPVAQGLTARGVALGTPAYMSPEQAQGAKAVDRRMDVYALGVMLYETLTGQLPFRGETAVEILVQATQADPTPPSRIVRTPDLDRTLEKICLRAIARRPDDRCPTARAFADDLTRWLTGEKVRVPASRRWIRGFPWRSLAGGAVGALLVGLVLHAEPWTWRPSSEGSLLSSVDPTRDALSGRWTRGPDGLVSSVDLERLQIPVRPPDEYDLRVEFTRLEGTGDVGIMLSHRDRSFAWVMGDFYAGFTVGQGPPGRNASSVRGRRVLLPKHRHVAEIRVRREGLSALLDGEVLSEWKGGYAEARLPASWSLRTPGTLGIGSLRSPVAFHAVELVPVSGR